MVMRYLLRFGRAIWEIYVEAFDSARSLLIFCIHEIKDCMVALFRRLLDLE